MKYFHRFAACLTLAALATSAIADERTLTPEEMEKLARTGQLLPEAEERPSSLPDLTKGDPLPKTKDKPQIWTLGPTGIAAIMVGNFAGDQLFVQGTLKGSPAEGKIFKGDVITGINGVKLEAGGHLGVTIGNAIIESEKAANGGVFTVSIWRDQNYVARSGTKDVSSIDVDQLFKQSTDDNTLYDWKPEEARAQEVRKMRFDEFPVKPSTLEVELKLRIFPEYSDTAPYDCPKTQAILEDAWKVLENKFVANPENKRSGRGGILEAMALVASGKPEHRELVHNWVRGSNSPWRPPTEPIGEMFKPGFRGYKGFQSWHKGFNGLQCALYYEATGDDYVLPALRKYAIETAMGQSAAGSWGHTFAYPSFNGGEFHRMNPGYGAINAAGNRCFFLITLAQKLGIEHPEIDLAVKRAQRFFSSYIDQGCIPYGDHNAYGSDDSNGKNTGVAFSLKLLGDEYGARYFAQMSAHCAFTRRGGHGHDYHGNWSSWAATLVGPEVRILNERNLRWRRTLCRMFDGSFVYQSPTAGKYGTLRDPTATEVLHQSSIFKQTLITGKDVDESWHLSEREMKQMLASAAGQFTDPHLKQLAGTPWQQRSSAEVFDLLDIFYPKTRHNIAKELGKRFQSGEKDIVDKLLVLLGDDSARYRDGALRALQACGTDTVLANLSRIIPLLDDPEDFVRISAVHAVAQAGDQPEVQLAMLKATLDEPKAVAPNSVRNATQNALFGTNSKIATQPFDAGVDPQQVQDALEEVILLDPAGKSFMRSRAEVWNKDTVIRLAGPLTYAAEQEQIADQMFANRSDPARALMAKFGYLEAPLSTAYRLRQKADIPAHLRPHFGFKRPLMNPQVVEQSPAIFHGLIGDIETVLTDNPNESITIRDDSTGWLTIITPLRDVHGIIAASIAATANKKIASPPSIATDVASLFDAELQQLDSAGARIKHCIQTLKQPQRRNIFRKLTAMERLSELLGPDAAEVLVPYLNHDYFRLREKSRILAADAITRGGGDLLVRQFQPAEDASTAIGILATFAQSGDKAGIDLARQALEFKVPELNQQAILTLATLQGEQAVDTILEMLAGRHEELVQSGCREALLQIAGTPANASAIRDRLIALLPQLELSGRTSVWYVLARLADPKSLDLLEKTGKTDSKAEFAQLVWAISYSPSRRADKILLDFAATDKASAAVVGAQAVRRLVLGPKGFGDITDKERMDFAEPMIQMAMDKQLIDFLSRIHDARALRSLMFCLENGVSSAAEALISNAESCKGYPPADSKIAADALRNVIEYIEVTQLRGGPAGKDFRLYPKWKMMQARAGKALLKVHKPEADPIPTFNDLEFE